MQSPKKLSRQTLCCAPISLTREYFMKKIILSVLFFAFMLDIVSTLNGMILLVEDDTGRPGEIVTVDIYIHTEVGEKVSAFGLNYNYDFSNLSFVHDSDAKCDLTQDFDYLLTNEAKDGTVIISGISATTPVGENNTGCFLSVQLEVRENSISGKYPMTIDNLTDFLEGAAVYNGLFEVIEPSVPKVDIYSNGSTFGAGDTLQISVKVDNITSDTLYMFAALYLGGNFFFYPQWNKTPTPTDINPGVWDEAILVLFLPVNCPIGTFTFYSAITDIQIANILAIDSVTIQIDPYD